MSQFHLLSIDFPSSFFLFGTSLPNETHPWFEEVKLCVEGTVSIMHQSEHISYPDAISNSDALPSHVRYKLLQDCNKIYNSIKQRKRNAILKAQFEGTFLI